MPSLLLSLPSHSSTAAAVVVVACSSQINESFLHPNSNPSPKTNHLLAPSDAADPYKTEKKETFSNFKTNCIGFSEDFIFTTPTENRNEIFALDPLTGAHLPLPPASLYTCARSRSCFPPLATCIVLNRYVRAALARLGGGGGSGSRGCWKPLRGTADITHDFIFHKGLFICGGQLLETVVSLCNVRARI